MCEQTNEHANERTNEQANGERTNEWTNERMNVRTKNVRTNERMNEQENQRADERTDKRTNLRVILREVLIRLQSKKYYGIWNVVCGIQILEGKIKPFSRNILSTNNLLVYWNWTEIPYSEYYRIKFLRTHKKPYNCKNYQRET